MKENWTYKKLGEVCTVSAGQGAPQGEENYCEDGVPFVKAGNVEELIQGLDEYSIQKVNEEVARSHRLKLYKAGSVVFAKSGMSCMKGLVYTLKNDCYVVSHLAVLTPRDVISSFLNYTLVYFKPNTLVKDEAYPSISLTDISNFTIPVPPIETQSRIVSELDLLQSIIYKQQAQLKELDNLAQAVFYDMFGDPVENDKGWERKPLKEIGKVITGNTPSTKDEENYSSNDYCFVKPSDIDKDAVSYITETEFYISSKAFEKSRQLPEGSVLTTCIGIIGKVGILKKKATCNQQINAIIPSDDISSTYLAYSIVGTKMVLELLANAPVLPIINKGDFSNVIIPVPPLSLQQSFASKIESIEKQKAAIGKSIEETQKLFDYTMDKYFG